MKGSGPRFRERPWAQSPDRSWPPFQEQTQAPRARTDPGSGCLLGMGAKFWEPHAPKSPALGGVGVADAAPGHHPETVVTTVGTTAALGRCSPAALSGERGISSRGSRRPFLPHRLDRGPERGSLPSAPRTRPRHPARPHPNSVDPGRAPRGGARFPYPAAAPDGSSAPRRAGHFFLGNFSLGPQG